MRSSMKKLLVPSLEASSFFESTHIRKMTKASFNVKEQSERRMNELGPSARRAKVTRGVTADQ